MVLVLTLAGKATRRWVRCIARFNQVKSSLVSTDTEGDSRGPSAARVLTAFDGFDRGPATPAGFDGFDRGPATPAGFDGFDRGPGNF